MSALDPQGRRSGKAAEIAPMGRTFGESATARRPEPRSFAGSPPSRTLVLGRGPAGERAQTFLERGGVLLLPDRAFDLGGVDGLLFGEFTRAGAKNISFDPRTGRLKAGRLRQADTARFAEVLGRYAAWAEGCVRDALPAYAARLQLGKTSYRPRPASAPLSARKDDRRLHADAFPSQPVQGRRILRVFRNVHPQGEERLWQLGEDFEAYAGRFLARARLRGRGRGRLLQALRITKGPRTPYDDLMLQLHDLAKTDEAYQSTALRDLVRFPAGATWIVLTDATVHAAVRGRYAFEQTFFLPIEAMAEPDNAPLCILERMTGRRLV